MAILLNLVKCIKLRYCFIIQTMLAHQLMRVEREGEWILQQHCLERILPCLFVAGHHNGLGLGLGLTLTLTQHCLERMLPCLFVAGHNNYGLGLG